MEDLSGRQLGQYRIQEEIGRGGMAVVYKAHQPALERYVAIKVLPQQFTFDREFVERFLREARAAARLNHPHIVTIHDVGQADGTYYIVMEYVEGPSLANLLRRQGALPPQQAAQIVAQVASALDYAHRQGFVHRDVKPSNVLLSAGGVAKLTDFGIVKAAEETRLTQTGTLLGTPEYMSPEQARGSETGYHTDIYSLGVLAYEMLAGRVPFSGVTMAVLHAHVYEPPDVRPLPAGVQGVVGKALAKDPRQRYGSAGAFAQALERAVAGVPVGRQTVESPTHIVRPRPRPVPAWVWGLGAAAIALVAGILLAFPKPVSTPTPYLAPTFQATHAPESPEVTPEAILPPTLTEEPVVPPTPSPTSTHEPTMARIAFVSGLVGNTDIYAMDANGGNLRRVVGRNCDEAEPAWSPDGTHIVYQADCGGSYDIWSVSGSGGSPTQLTRASGTDEREPDWSPDGSQIVYRTSRAGSDRNSDGELWVMSTSGSNQQRLGGTMVLGRSPTWSPDGRKMLFMSERSGRWQIYIYGLSTGNTTRLTNCSTNCRWPYWSPDGRYVAYHSTVSVTGGHSATSETIWGIPVGGGTPTVLTTGNHPGRPSWSSNGQIVFNSDRGIEVIAAHGSGRQVLLGGNENWAPDWSE